MKRYSSVAGSPLLGAFAGIGERLGRGLRTAIRAPAASGPPSYAVGTWLFLRLLGLVYLIAFISLWLQIDGLVGSAGILPVADYLERVREATGADRFLRLPTLLWLGAGDLSLHLLCAAGALFSLALLAAVAPRPVLLFLWAFYLSLSLGGQTFLSFQWDSLLLETGFCALFLAPRGYRPCGIRSAPSPDRLGLWLIWLLLFKLDRKRVV